MKMLFKYQSLGLLAVILLVFGCDNQECDLVIGQYELTNEIRKGGQETWYKLDADKNPIEIAALPSFAFPQDVIDTLISWQLNRHSIDKLELFPDHTAIINDSIDRFHFACDENDFFQFSMYDNFALAGLLYFNSGDWEELEFKYVFITLNKVFINGAYQKSGYAASRYRFDGDYFDPTSFLTNLIREETMNEDDIITLTPFELVYRRVN